MFGPKLDAREVFWISNITKKMSFQPNDFFNHSDEQRNKTDQPFKASPCSSGIPNVK